MLDKLHLCGIDEAGLTPDQWEAVIQLIGHNFGGLIGAATMALDRCARRPVAPEENTERASNVRAKYFEIIGTLKELRAGSQTQAAMERENKKLVRAACCVGET